MSIFSNVTNKVSSTARAVSKKSSDIVGVSKLNANISSEQEKIKRSYFEIGKLVYKAFTEGVDTPESVKQLCEGIRTGECSIEDMKFKILRLKGLKPCPGCGEELSEDVAFCPRCGTKQIMYDKYEDEPQENENEKDAEKQK